ncbi:MAG: M48 family metallopeptidase [Acidobacteria bacterium]|nr:M48 family metallopeptidase [Acidobacteriota bacterium]MDA1233248.1 M48 family metallopeptidase [Acidobacteriota bacterium]
MWEAIRANRRRSTWLMLAMGAVLIALGASIGILAASWARQPTVDDQLLGALLGSVLAIAVWLGSWLYTAADGDGMVLRSVGARRIAKQDHPRLWNIVEEMSIAAGLKNMPAIYVVDSSAPNAFAVGHTPEKSSVAFTSTLLRTLNRDELQGVAAHEIGHILNEDIRFMTQAAVLVGGVELLSQFLIRLGPLGGSGRRISGGGGGGGKRGGGAAPLMAIAFLVAILSPLAIRMLYYACSRTREYLADASAARLTRYPDGLASALEKIAAYQLTSPPIEVNSAVAPLYIVNPLERMQLSGISSTHPPTDSRVKILRAMGGGAGYVDYEAALKKVEGERLRLPELELAARTGERLRSRAADPNQDPLEDPVSRAHTALELIDGLAGYTTLLCLCGLRVKTPPESDAKHIGCPRCGRALDVPSTAAEKTAQPVALPAAVEVAGTLRYARAASDWEAFSCSCGQTIQLGAGYPLDYTICAKCDRRIEIA